MLDNDVCKAMIRDSNTEYETPGIKEIEGEMWKGKADIINHNEKLVIDLKTTADITNLNGLLLNTITTLKLIFTVSCSVMKWFLL